MYEKITYEKILERMLKKVPNSLDKREGSIIYDALAPAAIELQLMYIELDTVLEESFADTSSREYLIKRTKERGITPYPSTHALLKGEFTPTGLEIPIGARFNLEDLNYRVTEKICDGVYKVVCEEAGIKGNQYFGDMIPMDYINGLETAQLTELLVPGEDEEETEDLRMRFFDSLKSYSYGGNVADYKEKTMEQAAVGGVKVYPVWNGGGTVKLVIMDSTFGVPTSTLIDSVQTAVDPVVNAGEGEGFAPIGHVVTVEGVTSTTVDIATTITYQDGWSWADVEPYAKAAIETYFEELTATWDDEPNLIVRISQIETRLLNLQGIVDISGTTINTLAQNLVIGADSIPVRGVVSG